MDTKFNSQLGQYQFPYHWLPVLDRSGGVSLARSLAWGMDYLTYMDFISTRIANCKPASILDVGCGDGRFLDFICEKDKELKKTYTGIDLSEKAIAFARLLNDHEGFFCNDIATVKGEFEVITLIEVLEHVSDENIAHFLDHVRNRLSSEGRLWVSVPSVNVPVIEKHYRHYSTALLVETLQAAGFKIVKIYYIYKLSWMVNMIRRIVTNRFYTLNASPLTKIIWRLHRTVGYIADQHNCIHIVVEASHASTSARSSVI